MKLYLFDDAGARKWRPFHRTRPAGELLFGCLLLRQRAELFWSTPCAGHLAGEALLGFEEPGAPPVVVPAQVDEDEGRLLMSSRCVPAWSEAPEIDEAVTLRVGDEVAGWYLPAGEPTPPEAELLDLPRAVAEQDAVEIEGTMLQHPWDLITGNGDRVRTDVPALFPHSHAFLPAHVDQIGDEHPVSVGDDVVLEPGVVLDVRRGPVRMEDGVRVRSHTRLEGPAFVGERSTILGGSLAAVSIGPVCKIRGEVEESVVLGYANKAHDGYVGHAYLGRWVNLGAMTTNSDLKNNYGPIRVRHHETEIDTGLLKLGCFLGDHAKTGIGTLLNTGTVIGAGSNLFGAAMPPKYVPPFSWGSGRELGEYRLDAFLETAGRVMARRGHELTEELRVLLRRAWEESRQERGTG